MSKFLFLVPPSAVRLSTSAEGNSVAGESYRIFCIVKAPTGLSTLPEITWTNPNGTETHGQVNNTVVGSSIVVTSTVTFIPLLTSQSGVYMCQASLQSPSLLQPLNIYATVTVSVQS